MKWCLQSGMSLRKEKALPSSYGNGYGLYICQEIMNKQGGSMRIESNEEIGTTIFITFFASEKDGRYKKT